MQVKKGTECDYSACLKIAGELTDFFNKKGIEQLESDLKKHDLYLLTEEEKITGFLTLLKKNRESSEITWMAIQKENQSQGGGTFFIEQISRNLKDLDFKVIEVKTLSASVNYKPYEKTRKFYEKCNFLILENDVIMPNWGEDNRCVIYIKIL